MEGTVCSYLDKFLVIFCCYYASDQDKEKTKPCWEGELEFSRGYMLFQLIQKLKTCVIRNKG